MTPEHFGDRLLTAFPAIPAGLRAKGRGSSAMALAVRTLQSCRPVEPPLARAAAESAAAALRDD